MEKRYQIILEKVMNNIKNNDIVNQEPTIDTNYLSDVNGMGTSANNKIASGNTANKQVAILPSDGSATAVVNY